MLSKKKLEILVLATILAALLVPASAAVVQYRVLASYDFLNADEVSGFENLTLAGNAWNSSLTSYTITNGVLNITNKDTSDAMLVLGKPLNGYAEVKFGGVGEVIVLMGNNTSTGFIVERTSSGIVVYMLNNTEKTTLASVSTSLDTVIITLMNGKFSVYLSDGTGVYEAPVDIISARIALAAPASDGTTTTTGVFDKIALYGFSLAGETEIDLGSKTVTATARIAKFDYDLSKYTNIRSAKLLITFATSDDGYVRKYIVATSDPGNDWANWPALGDTGVLDSGTVWFYGTREIDVTDLVKNNPSGSIYVGVSVGGTYSWTITAKLVIDADDTNNDDNDGTTTEIPDGDTSGSSNILQNKYLLAGVGIIVLIVIIAALAGGKKSRRGIAFLAAVFLVLLVLGGIAIAVMAWLHPEYLTAMAFGLGAIAVLVLIVMATSGKRIPNPMKASK